MTSQKVVNNPLGSYPVSIDRTAMGEQRQAVGIDIGDVVADVWTPSRVSATNPLPVTVGGSGVGSATSSPKYRDDAVALETPLQGQYTVATLQTVSGVSDTITFEHTGHSARRGDVISWLASGFSANPNVERTVVSTTTNTITLSVAVPNTIQIGDVYNLIRPRHLNLNASGSLEVTATTTLPISGSVLITNISGRATDFVTDTFAGEHNYLIGGAYNLDTDLVAPLYSRGSAPSAGDPGLVTRNIPSGTQAVSAASLPLPTGAATSALQTQPGVDIGDVTVNNAAGASAVNIQDGGNSITVDGIVTASLPATVSTTGNITASAQTIPVTLGELKLVTLDVSGTYGSVSLIFEISLDGTNYRTMLMARTDLNTAESTTGSISNTTRTWKAHCGAATHFRVRSTAWASGTMAVRINNTAAVSEPIPVIQSHAVTGSGTFAATQSGTWSVRAQDGSGNLLSSAVVPPAIGDRGLTVRQIGVYGGPSTATARTAIPQIPQGYYQYSSRTSNTGSTTTAIVVTADASTVCRRGDIIRIGSGTHAQGLYEWGVVASVATTTISLDTQTPLSLAITNGLTIQIWKPGYIAVDVDNAIKTNTTVVGGLINTTPISTNKTFFEAGSVVFGSITNTLATFYTTTNQGYMCEVANTTDVELGYSLDGGTSEHFIPAGQVSTWNLMDIGGYFSAGKDIQVYYPGPTAPTRGRASFMLAYY